MDSFRVFHNIQRGLNMQIKTVTVNNTKATSRSDSMTDESADFLPASHVAPSPMRMRSPLSRTSGLAEPQRQAEAIVRPAQ